MGLSHEFYIVPEKDTIKEKLLIQNLKQKDIRNVIVQDDIILYIFDSLKWINTYNPYKNEYCLGINYYGVSVFKDANIKKLYNIISSWIQLFDNAPNAFILKGSYVVEEDGNGHYEKIYIKKEKIIHELDTLRMIIRDAIDNDMYIVHYGI